MATDPQDKIDRLFSEALRRPADQRAAFLQEQCAEADVRRKVRSLLADYEAAADLFDGLADAAVAPMLSSLEDRGEPEEDVRGADPLDLEGTQVGRYRVEEHLGGGGMGIVYRARDPGLSRPVALKFLPPVLATSPEAEKRFDQEARAAAALGHSNIATIHEIGETERGRRFIAMAYYEGETLKEKLNREGTLPVDEALAYAEQIAEALARAHDAGIVHRDVKPANVMVTEAGEVKLLDFGLAKAATETRLTETGRQLGTAAYMSPEQAEGQEIDGRTDVWALGVVLYEMLAGERPFQGERRTAVIHSILHEEPDPLRAHRSEIPEAPEAIVGGCLRKNPDERYDSADALLNDLRAVRSEADAPPTGGAPLGAGTRRSRHRRFIGAAVAVLLLLGAAATWMLGPGGGAPSEPDRSVAVLPFESVGPNASDVFTEGLHNGVLTRLSGISDLTVISPKSGARYLDASISRSDIADTLGVRWIVEGDVRTAGNQIQVQARLVDPDTDAHVWANSYRQELGTENLFAIQGDITREIAGALQAKLTPEEQKRVRRRPTENLQAYRLYAKGRSQLDTRTAKGIAEAVGYFQQSLREDSTFALAWAGLADAQFLHEGYGPDSLGLSVPSREEAARRALKLDPDLAEAHASMSRLYIERQNGPAALRELKRAIQLKPSYAQAHHWIGILQLATGRPKSALKHLNLAADLSPHQPGILMMLAYAHLANGTPEAALTAARQVPKDVLGGRASTEAEVLFHLDRWTEARKVVRAARPEEAEGATADLLRFLPVMIDVATADAARARSRFSKMDVKQLSPFYKGLLHGALGNRDKAFAALRSINKWETLWILTELRYFYPDLLGPIRKDPRYDGLIHEINRELGLNPDGSLPAESRSPAPSQSRE